MTVSPSYSRCLIYAILFMACASAIGAFEFDGVSRRQVAILLGVMWVIFVPLGAAFMMAMSAVTIDDEKLTQFPRPFRVEISFDEVKTVRYALVGYIVSRGSLSMDMLLPTLFLKPNDRLALNNHLRKVLPADHPLMRVAKVSAQKR